jgi:transcriptional regulator with XRE-family HTH domain
MWLDNLKELKKRTGMTAKAIAKQANLPDATVENVLAGTVKNPRIDTIRQIVTALGGSLDEVFAESGAVIGDTKLAKLQEERDALIIEISEERAENTKLRTEVQLLQLKLDHKDEIIQHKEKIIELYEKNTPFGVSFSI